jgi:hypothetical protein
MAFFKGSAYERTPLFEPDETGKSVFKGLRARRLRNPEPVLEHTVAAKNRLDSVSHEYFAESRDWRWLAEANPDALFPEDLFWAEEVFGDAQVTPGEEPPEPGPRQSLGHVLIVPRRTEGG